MPWRDVFTTGDVVGSANGGTGFSTYNRGDLLVANSSGVLQRLAVGANGDVLVADDAESLGVRWSSSAGAAAAFTTIDCPSGTDPVATTASDTLTLAANAPVTITGNATTDTVTFGVSQATTTAVGVVELATDGENAANVVVQGNDGRLSNTRIPSSSNGGTAWSFAYNQITGLRVQGYATGSLPNLTNEYGAIVYDTTTQRLKVFLP